MRGNSVTTSTTDYIRCWVLAQVLLRRTPSHNNNGDIWFPTLSSFVHSFFYFHSYIILILIPPTETVQSFTLDHHFTSTSSHKETISQDTSSWEMHSLAPDVDPVQTEVESDAEVAQLSSPTAATSASQKNTTISTIPMSNETSITSQFEGTTTAPPTVPQKQLPQTSTVVTNSSQYSESNQSGMKATHPSFQSTLIRNPIEPFCFNAHDTRMYRTSQKKTTSCST